MAARSGRTQGAENSEQRQVEISKAVQDKLGNGAYGAVYRAKLNELPCAAKILHPILFETNDPAGQRIVQRFHQECDFMRDIQHPNIVQYLGVTTDSASGLPVLLMEILDESLTKFLERSRKPLPYHIQVNLSHDIALAIAHLHSKGIAHRDLSSNNVLLVAGCKAKVTDFGMSKLVNVSGHVSHHSLTQLPGTQVFMPPEAFVEPPDYTNKIDCFSFGPLVIQVITRLFPDPGPRSTFVPDPRSPTGNTQMPVLEVDRRMNHISLIDPSHPLLSIARQCLEYNPEERPTGQQLCRQLAALKELDQFTESKDQEIREQNDRQTAVEAKENEILHLQQQFQTEMQTKEATIGQLEQQVQNLFEESFEKETQLEQLSLKLEENAAQNEHLQQSLDEVTQIVKEKDVSIVNLGEQLQEKEKLVVEFQQTLAERDELAQVKEQTNQDSTDVSVDSNSEVVNLTWREGMRASWKMYHGSTAVDGGIAYFKNGRNKDIYQYTPDPEQWLKVPTCPRNGFSIVHLEGLLTAIGGVDSSTKDTLLSLAYERGIRKWIEKYPPMPTKRYNTTSVANGKTLVVIGGMSESDKSLPTVELMDIGKRQWYKACDLPQPIHDPSAAISSHSIYLAGWRDEGNVPSKGVLTCSLAQLEQHATPHSIRVWLSKTITGSKQQPTDPIWKRLADLPMTNSTFATIREDQLLAIGGENGENKEYSRGIFKYDSNNDSWELVSKMATGRSCCLVAIVSTNKIVVVGGYIGVGTYTDVVEIAFF